uniref:ANK_REP_REGION domain-containing protein n=1 Tax=Rhabditophanes sp. KR3021 TaxID=114890 RepID=A0AC35UIE7_9BILA
MNSGILTNSDKENPSPLLLQCIKEGRVDVLKSMLTQLGVSVNSFDSEVTKNTPLHWAASFGNEEIVKAICDNSADINCRNSKGQTPLHDAVRREEESIVRLLVNLGADIHIKDEKNNESPFEIAKAKNSSLVAIMSLSDVNEQLKNQQLSEEDQFDTASIISTDASFTFNNNTNECMDNNDYVNTKIESWTDLLWPKPQFLQIEKGSSILFPKDNRMKVYFSSNSEGSPRKMMQIIQTVSSVLASVNLEIEYRGHEVVDSLLEGRIVCGIYDIGKKCSYSLTVSESGIEIYANTYAGIKYGFCTLCQIFRLTDKPITVANDNKFMSIYESQQTSPLNNQSMVPLNFVRQIPCLVVRDYSELEIRAISCDFSGCKILTTESVLQIATRLAYVKANYLFLNFEVRTTDSYILPYTNSQIFQMTQVCEELFITLVPSLDFQTSSIELEDARQFIEQFLDDFPLQREVAFGENISKILLQNKTLLHAISKRVKKVFLSIELLENNINQINALPPYCILSLECKYPLDIENKLSARVNIILRHSVSDVGFLTASQESIAKQALLLQKLSSKMFVLGTIICDLSTGIEIIPPCFSYMSQISSVGLSWNKSLDFRRYSFLMARITAEHILLDGNLGVLFEQAMLLGRVEHEITKYSIGQNKLSGVGQSMPKNVISIFVEILLNPDNIRLERLTPQIFKRATIECKKSLRCLKESQYLLHNKYDLALTLTEITGIARLLLLLSTIGQNLTLYGGNDTGNKNVLSVGLLPSNVRTDMANSLLDIRQKFQFTWLSRNMAITLPNSLKIFDNLFRALLPKDLQDYSKMVL